MEKTTPNTDEVEKIKMVFIVPILFNPCKKKKIDAANPTAPRSMIFGMYVKLMFILILDATTIAISNKPPIRDFS